MTKLRVMGNLAALLVLGSTLSGCSAPDTVGGGVSAAEDPARAPAAPDTPAGSLVARSIEFHDPNGIWGSRPIELDWAGTNGAGEERVAVRVAFGADQADFTLSGRYAGSAIEYETSAESWSATVDGEADMSEETRERMRLHREDGYFWRSYYGFLAGLPMKILDPGTILDPDVTETTFMDRLVHAVRVTYEPDVGGDIWYFYFDPETAELVGSRFYHDESANDGEYLIFEGLTEAEG
ncbi:MAG: DUF6503 family protein, partial [Gemmatimonadetes bacterium]|nr:DUF6503 family protein [Gemmatimonadota bacterium]